MDRKYGILLLVCCIVCIVISGCTSPSSGEKTAADMTEEVVFTGPEISADCVVTFYDEKGSKYYSGQQHTIHPEDLAIKIRANEPEGCFEYTLYGGNFTANTDNKLCSSKIARAIVLAVAAKGGFLGDKAGIVEDPVSIAGRMYQPVVLDISDSSAAIQKIYREVSSNQIDWVEIKDLKENALIAARSYNLRKISDSDILMPASIDIYTTDRYGRPADLIMKIDYKSFTLSTKTPSDP